jgi:hypothetical protein
MSNPLLYEPITPFGTGTPADLRYRFRLRRAIRDDYVRNAIEHWFTSGALNRAADPAAPLRGP